MASANSSYLPFQSINIPSFEAYQDRAEAGKRLAEALSLYDIHRQDPLVLALPRGGVPVAHQVASTLLIPLDIFLTRKFEFFYAPDLHPGIVTSGGVLLLEPAFEREVSQNSALAVDVQLKASREQAELARRELSYRQSRTAEPIEGRSVIVIDDGLTTGATMRNAVRALRRLRPARIIAAVPVASPEVCAELQSDADIVVCPHTPNSFFSVRRCYRDFSPVLDSDIRYLLDSVSPHQQSTNAAFRA